MLINIIVNDSSPEKWHNFLLRYGWWKKWYDFIWLILHTEGYGNYKGPIAYMKYFKNLWCKTNRPWSYLLNHSAKSIKERLPALKSGPLEYGADSDLQLCCVRPIQLVSYSFLWGGVQFPLWCQCSKSKILIQPLGKKGSWLIWVAGATDKALSAIQWMSLKGIIQKNVNV